MQNVYDIISYNEDFVDRVINEVLSIHTLWSIRPLDNLKRVLISGTSSETEKFSNFFHNHIQKEYPFPLHIYIGNGEKNYPNIMLHTKRTSVKVKFDQLFPNYIGKPLIMPEFLPKFQ